MAPSSHPLQVVLAPWQTTAEVAVEDTVVTEGFLFHPVVPFVSSALGGNRNSSFLLPQIYQKIPSTDPSSNKTQQVIASIRTMSLPGGPMVSRHHYSPIYLSCAMLLAALSWQYLSTISKATEEYVQAGEN